MDRDNQNLLTRNGDIKNMMIITKYLMALNQDDKLGIYRGYVYIGKHNTKTDIVELFEEDGRGYQSSLGTNIYKSELLKSFAEMTKEDYDTYFLSAVNDEPDINNALRDKYVAYNPPLTKKLFSIEGSYSYEGYTEGKFWNGWACPMFTLETAKKMMDEMTVEGLMEIYYSEKLDKFVVLFENDSPEEYGANTHYIDGEIVKLYHIGNGSWCWDQENIEFLEFL